MPPNMATYLLTWNRALWPWADLQREIATIQQQGACRHAWGCGVTRRIVPGDRAFLMKVGREPRGITGSGWVESPAYEQPFLDEATGRTSVALCIDVAFDVLLDPAVDILPLAWLRQRTGGAMSWTPQASGTSIPLDIAALLEEDWARFLGRQR